MRKSPNRLSFPDFAFCILHFAFRAQPDKPKFEKEATLCWPPFERLWERLRPARGGFEILAVEAGKEQESGEIEDHGDEKIADKVHGHEEPTVGVSGGGIEGELVDLMSAEAEHENHRAHQKCRELQGIFEGNQAGKGEQSLGLAGIALQGLLHRKLLLIATLQKQGKQDGQSILQNFQDVQGSEHEEFLFPKILKARLVKSNKSFL